MSNLRPEHVEWQRQVFQLLRIGGVWAFPGAGLIFRRRAENVVVCDDSMPFQEGMPGSPEEWQKHQDDSYEAVRQRGEAAGFVMLDERKKSQQA